MTLPPAPTVDEHQQSTHLVHDFIDRINSGEIALGVACDVGLNLFAQMTLELGVTLLEATEAVAMAREHIERQALIRNQSTNQQPTH